jgi:hypothetical protein
MFIYSWTWHCYEQLEIDRSGRKEIALQAMPDFVFFGLLNTKSMHSITLEVFLTGWSMANSLKGQWCDIYCLK